MKAGKVRWGKWGGNGAGETQLDAGGKRRPSESHFSLIRLLFRINIVQLHLKLS